MIDKTLEIKLRLTQELPNLIRNVEDIFIWRDTGLLIHDREWDWIVNECWNKLNGKGDCHHSWQKDANTYFDAVDSEFQRAFELVFRS